MTYNVFGGTLNLALSVHLALYQQHFVCLLLNYVLLL